MTFKKFNSIENTSRTNFVDEVRQHLPDDEIYAVSEKIHGANISWWWTKVGIKCGIRNKFLEEGTNFYNWEQVLEKYRPNIQNVIQKIIEDRGDTPTEVIFYGEILEAIILTTMLKLLMVHSKFKVKYIIAPTTILSHLTSK